MCAATPRVIQAAIVVQQQDVTVSKYEYYMRGKYVGELYFKEPTRQCAWWSETTQLRTDWHGAWAPFDGCGFVARFNYEGRSDMHKHVVIYSNMRGKDYGGRDVSVIFRDRWAFDATTADYVCL